MNCDRCEKDVSFFKMTTMTYKIHLGMCKIAKIKRTVCDDCHLVYSNLDERCINIMNNPILKRMVKIENF